VGHLSARFRHFQGEFLDENGVVFPGSKTKSLRRESQVREAVRVLHSEASSSDGISSIDRG